MGASNSFPRVAEYPPEDDVEYLHQRVVGAEGLAEREDVPIRLHLALKPGEVAHVAATEAVDRLLDVSDKEPLRSWLAGVPAS